MGGKMFAFVAAVALPLLLVRRLDQTEFGLYKQVFLVITTATTVLPLGFAMSAFYFLPRETDQQGQVAINVVIFNAIAGAIACVALFVWPGLLVDIFGNSELHPHARPLAIALLLWVAASPLETLALASRETKLAAMMIVGTQVVKSALMIGAAVAFGTVQALVHSAVLFGAAQVVGLFIYVRWRFVRSFSINWNLFGAQMAYALPLGMSGMLYYLQNDLHNYFVANRFGASAFATYAVGCFQLPVVGLLAESVNSVMIPQVSVLSRQNDKEEIIRLTARAMRKLAAIFFPSYVFLMVVGREVLILLFTRAYETSWPIFAVNLTLIPAAILVFDPVARAFPSERYFLLHLKIVIFVLMCAALWFGTERLGLLGVISLVVVLSIVERVIVAARLGRTLGLNKTHIRLLDDVGKCAIAALGAGVPAYAMKKVLAGTTASAVTIAVCAATFGVAYLLLAWGLALLNEQERTFVRHMPARVWRSSPWAKRA